MSETEKGWDRDRGRRVSDDLMDKLNAASKGSNVLTLDPSAIADIYGELIDRRDEARALREALEKIAHVVGETDPAIMWPWAQAEARAALSSTGDRNG